MRGSGHYQQAVRRWEGASLELSQASDLTLAIPADVRLIGGIAGEPVLVWSEAVIVEEREATGSLLPFMRLADATDEQVLVFVRRWGPLGVDAAVALEQRYSKHKWEWYVDVQEFLDTCGMDPPPPERFFRAESPDLYRTLARQARAALNVAAALRQGRRADPGDLTVLMSFPPPPAMPGWSSPEWPPAETRRVHQVLLTQAVTQWLRNARAYPMLVSDGDGIRLTLGFDFGMSPVTWLDRYMEPLAEHRTPFAQLATAIWTKVEADDERRALIKKEGLESEAARRIPLSPHPRYELENSPSPLYAAIALQLASAITSTIGVYHCSICRSPYEPERKPREDRQNFCGEECSAEANRRRNKEQKRKERAPSRPDDGS